ncbi:hypothetical protein [Polyangium spumosum]|uniref:Uncharacterized protein n=1 Tax=Polyangium spumosum TaxID=889282 RepID=A0A6N7PQX4_9BACT|nr:hypothetical protein [Polyangium spumosum]MRG91251.1 hypothetical protein [Polyangium spumosum]
MQIRSFKLRARDHHVRVVPATDHEGCPFSGPGVDLRGERAEQALEAAGPLFAALAAFEPGVVIRSLSFDLERGRLLATLEPTTPERDARPRVVRIDGGPALQTLLPLIASLATSLSAIATPVLAARPKDHEQREDR